MRRSVQTHAGAVESLDIADPLLFERGLGHFHTGCAPCHGAPGRPADAVAQHMLPPPPDLGKVVAHWTPSQLHWIVKHGLKYTGMPAWPAPSRADEVSAVVAVLARLPQITPQEYRSLVAAGDVRRDAAPTAFLDSDAVACGRCHGENGEGSTLGSVPRIAGQKSEYMLMTLTDYALGTRPSGIMGPVAASLGSDERRRLSDQYAALGRGFLHRDATAGDSRLLELGGRIAAEGIPHRSIPACEACHGPQGRAEGKNRRYPALAGQHVAYLEQQLKLWRAATRGGSFGPIMAVAARRLTDEEIRAVALHYANAIGSEASR
jgi:cytochrome c553